MSNLGLVLGELTPPFGPFHIRLVARDEIVNVLVNVAITLPENRVENKICGSKRVDQCNGVWFE